jgi:hypothetical protein
VATFLLLLCIGAGCAVIGILFMLYGPTSSGVLRVRTPPAPMAFAPNASAPVHATSNASFVPIAHSLSTDFSAEEPVREVRIRAKSPSPPPLPPVTPMPPPPATPTTPPRLGVSAPSARARHLEPPRRMPPPMPRSRSARGSDGPPLSFSTDQQRTAPRELDEFSTAEHTFVD